MSEFEDHCEFLRVEQRSGKNLVLSRAACMLGLYAAAASLRSTTPGFIGDDRLGSDTSLSAMELVLSGHWRRAEGGYQIGDE